MFRTLFKRVGPVAQMVHSSHDVQEELPGLVQGDRGKRPADIFLFLNAYFLDSKSKSDYTCVLCDIATKRTPKASTPEQQKYTNLHNLQSSEKEKFRGPAIREDEDPRTVATGYELISYILRNKMILIPIVIDPFSQLCPVFGLLLYKKKQVNSRIPQHRDGQRSRTTDADNSEKACTDRLIG